ncbi:MAG: rane protein insertion efficiency factor YidD [Bacteroidetes bacterium]|nr:rane protein insertion efficiency factor YidD [Bacteroidota bacterium]
MRSFLIILITFSSCFIIGQSSNDFESVMKKDFTDSSIIKKHKVNYVFKNKNAFIKYNPVSLVFGGALLFYQGVISRQIMQGCAFNPSCSNFSKQSIKTFGLGKGLALSADRLTRCTKLSSADFHPVMFSDNGKVNDLPEYYRLHEHK